MHSKIVEDFGKYVSIIKVIISPDGLIKIRPDGTRNKKAFKEFKLLNMAIFEAVRCEGFYEQDYAKKLEIVSNSIRPDTSEQCPTIKKLENEEKVHLFESNIHEEENK
uniref:Uncharacterized protein n=1 Tax=Musca domestica TaxID=7370 RepID=A0A1I8NG58_MUSDO